MQVMHHTRHVSERSVAGGSAKASWFCVSIIHSPGVQILLLNGRRAERYNQFDPAHSTQVGVLCVFVVTKEVVF